jgi:hypothetical protein
MIGVCLHRFDHHHCWIFRAASCDKPACPRQHKSGLPPGPTRTIALLAALAAALTAGGNLAINRGHDNYAKADQARAIINQTVANLAVAGRRRHRVAKTCP